MPRVPRGRRAGRPRVVRRRRYGRARRVARRRMGINGFLRWQRKLSMIQLYANTGVVGACTLNDPSGSCVSLGTPVVVPGSADHYDIPFSLKFRLDQVMNATDITNAFDQYKINSAKVKIHCNFNTAGDGVGQFSRAYLIPWVEYCQDHDDAAVPTLSFMREKMGVKNKYFNASRPAISMGVRPRFADTVFSNGITSGYAVGRKQWLNTTYSSVEHYSIKGVIHNVALLGSGTGPLFDIDVALYGVAKDFQ